ncbi:MAG TPA: hypothetical protein VLA34_06110, partial [Candidatus Krumholzibacterium sp.]|nr:hypothetical protein [Candidatus Krumholzibacterium sp.]
LLVFGSRAASGTVRAASAVLFYLLPNLESFNWKNEVVHGSARSGAVLPLAAAYLLTYCAAVLVLACLIFSRKDFK